VAKKACFFDFFQIKYRENIEKAVPRTDFSNGIDFWNSLNKSQESQKSIPFNPTKIPFNPNSNGLPQIYALLFFAQQSESPKYIVPFAMPAKENDRSSCLVLLAVSKRARLKDCKPSIL
jgi:hypothetical protein